MDRRDVRRILVEFFFTHRPDQPARQVRTTIEIQLFLPPISQLHSLLSPFSLSPAFRPWSKLEAIYVDLSATAVDARGSNPLRNAASAKRRSRVQDTGWFEAEQLPEVSIAATHLSFASNACAPMAADSESSGSRGLDSPPWQLCGAPEVLLSAGSPWRLRGPASYR
jgi:hypothetical protein